MLTVRRVGGRWRIGHSDGAEAAAPSNNDAPERAVYPADGPALWRLELSKTANALGAGESAQLKVFAERCRAEPYETHLLGTHALGKATPPPAVLRALGDELKLRHGALDALLAARFFAAAIVALGAVLAHLLSALARSDDALSSSRAIPVMHGEDANRTRHLIGALAAERYDGDVVVVGRPRMSMRRFRALLEARGVFAKIIRPFDRDALWRALQSAPTRLIKGYGIARLQPIEPSLREHSRHS